MRRKVMSEKVSNIQSEDLVLINNARGKLLTLASKADAAVAEAKIADLELQVIIRNTYLKYGLNIQCKVDETTGAVTYPETEKVVETETKEELNETE
jgi:hypothetical protein